MLSHTFPLLASMQNVTICLEKILEKAQFDSVALVHLNTTIDFADTIYEQLATDTNYAWMRFDMANNSTLENYFIERNSLTNIFFVYVLDNFSNWEEIIMFSISTQLDQRENHIYIVNQHPTLEELKLSGSELFYRQFYNFGIFFWDSSSRVEAYTYNGFQEDSIIKIPLVNDQCCDTIYDQIFFDKTLNFCGSNLTVYGQTNPPRIVKTVSSVNKLNKQNEYSIAGHDVLIIDVISKHLNASPKYKLILITINPINSTTSTSTNKPIGNIEHKTFNVSQIVRYDWEVPTDNNLLRSPGIDMNSRQANHAEYIATKRIKFTTFLYPHDTDSFLIVVPKRLNSKTDYGQIFNSALIFVWTPVTISATIVRYIFHKVKKSDRNIVDLYLQTFGLSLGMSFDTAITSAAENLLLWWFCLGTMLSGMLLSSSMFEGFSLETDVPTINNLKELEMSGLPIYAPSMTETVKEFIESIPLKLKLKYRDEFRITQMIYDGYTNNAYIIGKGKFNVMFKNDDNAWHVIEQFGARHLSFNLHLHSGIEDRMNNLIQKCVDHGIVSYLVAKNQLILSGSRSADPKVIANSNDVKPVSFSNMQDSFLLYVLCILLSSMIFIAEGIYFRISLRRRKKLAKNRLIQNLKIISNSKEHVARQSKIN